MRIWSTFLFFPFLLLLMWLAYSIQRWRIDQRRSAQHALVGKPFPDLPLLDTAGRSFQPDFSRSPYTLVDAWFGNCPYCLSEMRRFNDLPDGDSLRVISLSVDAFEEWKALLNGKVPRWAFLSSRQKNWEHAVVSNPGKGKKPGAEVLLEQLGVSSYPAFFVVNRQGRIVAAPASAQDWQPLEKPSRNKWAFVTSREVWSPLRYLAVFLLALLLYRWIVGTIGTLKNRKEA